MDEKRIHEEDLFGEIERAFLNILNFQTVLGTIGDGQDIDSGHVFALSDIFDAVVEGVEREFKELGAFVKANLGQVLIQHPIYDSGLIGIGTLSGVRFVPTNGSGDQGKEEASGEATA
jgi:hypothetical protein